MQDLPESYDTRLGDDGVRLSGGQKQQVALAQGSIEDADLLILTDKRIDTRRTRITPFDGANGGSLVNRFHVISSTSMILDEATSNLDSNLEKQVQRAIKEMDRDDAIITIVHRLLTVKNPDRIYTIEEWKITEAGEHRELIDNGGKYSELYGIQSSG